MFSQVVTSASIADFQVSPAYAYSREVNKQKQGHVQILEINAESYLHALVKVTSEFRALILEGREFHNLPVEYLKDFR